MGKAVQVAKSGNIQSEGGDLVSKVSGGFANDISGKIGGVQTRINIVFYPAKTTPLRNNGKAASAGFKHVMDDHFKLPVTNHRSVFSISPSELKRVLQSNIVVSSPVAAFEGGQFVRTVDIGKVIGTTNLRDGGRSTTFIKVLTDRAGNLITTYPVKGDK